MNIAYAFANWLKDNGYGTLGSASSDIFVGGAPLQKPNKCFWLLSGGGSSVGKNVTGEKQKAYLVSVYYRNLDAEDVYNTLQALEEEINSKGCITIDPYTTIEAEATSFPTDQDIDNEDRTVGLLQVTLTVYQNS